MQSFFETIVTIDNFCEGDLTTFDIEDSSTIQEVHWEFGDIESGADNFSEDFNAGHVFSAPGVYTVNVDVLYNNGSERNFIEFVEIVGVPQVAPDIELVQCDIDGVDDGITSFNLNESVKIFNNGNRNIKALFFDNLADAISNTGQLNPIGYMNLTNGQTIYARAFENAECFVIIEISLSVRPASNLGLYDTIEVCELDIARNPTLNMNDILIPLQDDFFQAQSITVYASEEDALYELDPIITDNYTLEPLALPILYFRIENDDACDFIGSVGLSFIWAPDYEKQKVVLLCNNEANLHALPDYDRYEWSNGENSESIRVDSAGIYEVTFTKGTCSYVQIFMVEESPKIEIDEIKVNDFRVSNEIVIQVSEDGQQQVLYSIDDGLSFQESNTFQNLTPGVYEILITNDCTELKETVVVGAVDSFFTPNNDGINDIWTFENAEYFPNFSISIYDRYGKLIKTFQEAQEGWDGTYLERQMPSADYWYKLKLEGKREITGHFTLKR
ncbi:T9SS type B sorting domain-containing protein [Maribacter halichondriae]|uniref:T9SS type B sorting domain-containing protein n=1 Tax=Maribacter halichondriae TaxID=2980554 RepID=UPI003076542C